MSDETQNAQRRHRWPSTSPRAPGRGRPLAEPDLERYGRAVGDLTAAVRSLAPSVLDTSTYLLDANGQATRTFRVPFAAVAVLSGSLNTLTITAAPPGPSAPGPSAGAGQVPILGFAAHNISGRAFTLYGGNPGDLVTVSVFGRPVPPVAESGQVTVTGNVTQAAFGQPSFAKTAAVTGPAAFGTIAGLTALPAGFYQVDWTASLAGTVTGADGNNMEIKNNATVVTQAQYPSATLSTPVAQPRLYFRNPAAGGTFTVIAIAAGGASAIYQAQIVATQIGP